MEITPDGEENVKRVVCEWCGRIIRDSKAFVCRTIHIPEAGPCGKRFCSPEHHDDHLDATEGRE